jgi:DNA repair protein RadA/Sms
MEHARGRSGREKHNPAGAACRRKVRLSRNQTHKRISEIDATESPRMDTTNAEFNRVLGGGLVPGSVTLLGGEPGMVSLRCCYNRVPPFKTPMFLEKSAQQIKMRAERIKKDVDNCYILTETKRKNIRQVAENQPQALMIFIQTLQTDHIYRALQVVFSRHECTRSL